MAKRNGSGKYRSARNGAKHSVEDCPICKGMYCRVIVSNPVDGEFEARLVRLVNGRTELEAIGPVSPRNNREIESSGLSGMSNDPRLAGWEGPRYDPKGLVIVRRAHIQTATILAMQALQTWGASNARL